MTKRVNPIQNAPHRVWGARTRTFRVIIVVSALVFFSSCSDQKMLAPTVGNTAKWLTGAALKGFDNNGHFALSASPIGELSDQQARQLAAVYLRRGSRWLANAWEHDRGAEIDFQSLVICPKAYYARAVFDLRGAGNRSLRDRLGGKWLFAACTTSGVPVVSIAVSALATDLTVVNGELKGPGGGQFTSAGIPMGLSAVPIAPEEAVRIAGEATGHLVSAVPELILPPPTFPPQLAKWRIQLDGPVTLVGRNTGRRVSTKELYVGFPETWRSTDIQLGTEADAVHGFRDAEGNGAMISVSAAPGYATHFERATVDTTATAVSTTAEAAREIHK